MRKSHPWLVSFAALALAATVPTAGAQTLRCVDTSGAPGDQVTVDVIYDTGANDVVAYQFDVDYDEAVLRLDSSTDALAPHIYRDNLTFSTSSMRGVVYHDQNAVLLTGSKATLTFTIDAAAPEGPTPLTLSNVVLSMADATSPPVGDVTVTGCSIEVKADGCFVCGDLNDDGVTDGVDVVRLIRARLLAPGVPDCPPTEAVPPDYVNYCDCCDLDANGTCPDDTATGGIDVFYALRCNVAFFDCTQGCPARPL